MLVIRSTLSCADWIPDVKKAKVTKKVGKVWENLGHHSNDEDWLFPEEALLLLETVSISYLFIFYFLKGLFVLLVIYLRRYRK